MKWASDGAAIAPATWKTTSAPETSASRAAGSSIAPGTTRHPERATVADGPRARQDTSAPASRSSRWPPTKPVAPVIATRTVRSPRPTARPFDGAAARSPDRPVVEPIRLVDLEAEVREAVPHRVVVLEDPARLRPAVATAMRLLPDLLVQERVDTSPAPLGDRTEEQDAQPIDAAAGLQDPQDAGKQSSRRILPQRDIEVGQDHRESDGL